MIETHWSQTGASPRGTPAFRRAFRRHPVFTLVLALAALCQTGCQSGFCGPCGGKFRNLSERMFRPIRHVMNGAGKCCGGDIGVESAPGLQYGSGTPTIVSPAPSVSPSGVGTTVIPGPADSMTPELQPIPERVPSASPGPPPAGSGVDSTPSQGAKSPNGKANYEAFRPLRQNGQARTDALSRKLDASPEPTLRSAQGTSRPSPPVEPNPLDNLPMLDLNLEVPPSDLTAPPGPAPARERKPAASRVPPPASETLADLAAKPTTGEVFAEPGIRRFSGVESKLAGGSLPSTPGLDWLLEKGYKTVLDLREQVDASPAFIAEVSRRGMRYLALPIDPKSLDAGLVARFNFEVSLAEARPLYFFDTDGSRAGLMWYIHRVTVDKVGEIVARRDAEELGLSDPKFRLAADAYLASLKPAEIPIASPNRMPAPDPNPPAPPPARLKARPVEPKSASVDRPVPPADAGANAPPAPSAGPPPGESAEADATPDLPRDPNAWKSVAAFVAGGLGIPLAYVGRSLPVGVISRARASLPGPRRSMRSLPGSSDV